MPAPRGHPLAAARDDDVPPLSRFPIPDSRFPTPSSCIPTGAPTSSVETQQDPRLSAESDVLRGTLDLLILKTLTLEAMHGWGIGARIQQFSRGILDVNQGSLYPALQRLEQKGWIVSEWRTTENNRRAKYYRLTPAGRRAVGAETANWRRYVEAVELILDIA
jgi:PadR family transcriptional regulator PadR